MFGRVFGMQTVVGTGLDDLDFVHLAKGQGIGMATKVSDAAALDAALADAFACDIPNLIEALIE